MLRIYSNPDPHGSYSVASYDTQGEADPQVPHSVTSYDTQGDAEDLYLRITEWVKIANQKLL
jgi:hypothetical protein